MSETVVRWGKELARNYIEKLSLSPPDLVAELASNDGCILKPFQTHSRVIGIEPARNIAAIANQAGIETIAPFLDSKLARELRLQYGPAKLVIARQLLPPRPDLQGVPSR